MNDTKNAIKYESLVLRVLWMLVFLLAAGGTTGSWRAGAACS